MVARINLIRVLLTSGLGAGKAKEGVEVGVQMSNSYNASRCRY